MGRKELMESSWTPVVSRRLLSLTIQALEYSSSVWAFQPVLSPLTEVCLQSEREWFVFSFPFSFVTVMLSHAKQVFPLEEDT